MAAQRCFSLLLGARNTPQAGRTFTRADDARIREITFRFFPAGFTVLHADGGWFDPERRAFVAEESRQILVLARSSAALRPWCQELMLALRQKELLVVELGKAVKFKLSRRAPAGGSGRRRRISGRRGLVLIRKPA